MQSVHFVYAYLRVAPVADRTVQFAVPCGAGGHLAAGLLAVQMGLPVRLIAATNANDAMHRALSSGVLQGGRPTVQTASPSMDIQMPYNLWRVLYVASGGDGHAVRRWQAMLATGRLELPSLVVEWLGERVRSVAIGDDETMATVRTVHSQSGYVLDPHTAVGLAAARRSPFAASHAAATPPPAGLTAAAVATRGELDALGGAAVPQSEPIICLGCAHAIKFLPSVAEALRHTVEAVLRAMPERETHRCVAAVSRMASECIVMSAKGPADQQPRPHAVSIAPPAGCTTVFRQGEDWERSGHSRRQSLDKGQYGRLSSLGGGGWRRVVGSRDAGFRAGDCLRLCPLRSHSSLSLRLGSG